MEVFRPASSGQISPQDLASSADPRLRPTPDYGTLGPTSDVVQMHPNAAATPAGPASNLARPLFVVAVGILGAFLVMGLVSTRSSRSHSGKSVPSAAPGRAQGSEQGLSRIGRMKLQKQAEALLELAVAHSDGAVEQIATRADGWHGRLQWDSQISMLTTAALNSPDMRVRRSGIEVELVAYGLAKNSASLEYLLKMADSSDHAQKIWALWALGLMGNCGVETDRVIETLTAHLKDTDEDSRRWAVEGLALVGTSETIPVLLQAMHDDPSPSVRERAACSLAESGMFTPEQRLSAVPQLLNYTDDASLDAQTHTWAFQALGDITHQSLPNDSAAWRSWYESTRN